MIKSIKHGRQMKSEGRYLIRQKDGFKDTFMNKTV